MRTHILKRGLFCWKVYRKYVNPSHCDLSDVLIAKVYGDRRSAITVKQALEKEKY